MAVLRATASRAYVSLCIAFVGEKDGATTYDITDGGKTWYAPGASSAGDASAGDTALDDVWWRDSRARPMSATSTAHDNDFAAAEALEDLEEAKHDPFEWLVSPIKLTPLETDVTQTGQYNARRTKIYL